MEINQWLTAAAVAVALVVGLSQAAATIWVGKPKDEAQSIFKGAFTTAVVVAQVALAVACVWFAFAGRLNIALACLCVNGAMYLIEFLSSRHAVQRWEIVQLVFYAVGIATLTLAGFILRIVDLLQLIHKGQ